MWGVTFLTFCLLNLLPGDAAQSLLGLDATPASVKALTLKLHLNEPFVVRYWHWLFAVVHGDLGTSLASGQSVSTILGSRLPVTLEVVGIAFVFSILIAVPVALTSAHKPKGVADRASIAVSMFGLSVPNFVFALLLILLVAVHLHLLPAIGYQPLSKGLWQNLRTMIMPAATLAFGLCCSYTRLLRGDLIDQMTGEAYIVTAEAKGISPWQVLVRHALRNSLFGLITIIGLNLGTLIGGTVLIEEIFALPGVGQALLQAIDNRDVPVVEAVVLVLAIAVVATNFITDVLYTVLDPRIRHGSRAS
jgi:peptide/nickel transport system permease protein